MRKTKANGKFRKNITCQNQQWIWYYYKECNKERMLSSKTACGLAKGHCLFQVWNIAMQCVFSGLKSLKLVNPTRTYCWPFIQSLLSQSKDWESGIHLTMHRYPHLAGHMRLPLYTTGRNGSCWSDASCTKADDWNRLNKSWSERVFLSIDYK